LEEQVREHKNAYDDFKNSSERKLVLIDRRLKDDVDPNIGDLKMQADSLEKILFSVQQE